MLDADLKMEVALAEGVSSRHRNGLASGMKLMEEDGDESNHDTFVGI